MGRKLRKCRSHREAGPYVVKENDCQEDGRSQVTGERLTTTGGEALRKKPSCLTLARGRSTVVGSGQGPGFRNKNFPRSDLKKPKKMGREKGPQVLEEIGAYGG